MGFEQYQEPFTGDWGPPIWDDRNGTQIYSAPSTVTPIDQTGAGAGQDRWTGFFQNLLGTVTQYAIAKDARQSGMVPAVAPNGQPIYTSAAAVQASNMSSLIIIAAIVGAALLLVKKG